MSCINCARIVPWHDQWHREMTNQQTVPVPFPIGGWHWHSDAKNGLINCYKLRVKMSERDAQIMCRRNRSLDSVERFLDFMPGCMKLCSAGGPTREAYLAILLLGLFLHLR